MMLVVSGWPLTFGYYRWDSLLSMKPLRSFVHVNLCHPGALISPQYWSFHFHFLLKIGADVKQAMWCKCFDIFSITTFSLSLSIKEWIRCEAGRECIKCDASALISHSTHFYQSFAHPFNKQIIREPFNTILRIFFPVRRAKIVFFFRIFFAEFEGSLPILYPPGRHLFCPKNDLRFLGVHPPHCALAEL